MSVHFITIVIGGSCIFYTAFGGLKAVLWTDAIQNVFTILALIFVVGVGSYKVGGVQEIWNISLKGNRIEMFNMDLDPFTRGTFWSFMLGSVVIFTTNIGVNPGSVQRYLAVSSLRKARLVLLVTFTGLCIIHALSCFLGLILYATYHDCDPIAAGLIKRPNQMVPLYLMEIGKDYPGLSGLFMSGVLSAALSTMSAWLNTVGGSIYQDLAKVCFPNVQYSDTQQATTIKVIVVALGMMTIMLVTVVENLGTILQISITLQGLINGSLLILFSLGMFFPRANSKGVTAGTLSSLVVTGWISFHAQYYIMEEKIQFLGKVTSIAECPKDMSGYFNSSLLYNYTGVGTPVLAHTSVPQLYRLSFNYYPVLGAITGLVVGMSVSLMTQPPSPSSLNPCLFTPFVKRLLPASAATGAEYRPGKLVRSSKGDKMNGEDSTFINL